MKNYQELLDKVVKLATEDLDFRKSLLEDANKAIKERFNEDIPTKVTFYESKLEHLVFVLPVETNLNAKEKLGEDSLYSIAGGKVRPGGKPKPATPTVAPTPMVPRVPTVTPKPAVVVPSVAPSAPAVVVPSVAPSAPAVVAPSVEPSAPAVVDEPETSTSQPYKGFYVKIDD